MPVTIDSLHLNEVCTHCGVNIMYLDVCPFLQHFSNSMVVCCHLHYVFLLTPLNVGLATYCRIIVGET